MILACGELARFGTKSDHHRIYVQELSRSGFDMSEDTRQRSGLRARQAGEEARRVVVVGRVAQGRVRVRRPQEEKEEGCPSKNSSSGDKLTMVASVGKAPAVRANASWT